MLELIFQGFMEWAYGLALECWEYFSSSLLDIMSMDYAYMKSHVPVMVSIAQVLLAVGWALLIGNLVFQALKSMAVGLGFEGEDPKLLFTRTFVFAFLLMASPQICEVGLSLTARIIELLEIPDAINVTLVDEGVFGSLGVAWLLVIIFGLIIMFKVFRLLLEIAERYVILAVLTMTAPLAFAMGGSKSTSEIFGGWCRMFGSMCTLMVTNVIFFKMLLSVLSNVPSGLDIIPWIVLVLTIVKVARKADAIITRIGLNPAITGDSLGRGFPGTLTYGNVLTPALFEYKKQQYPDGVGNYADFIKDHWLGRRTADCIGLIKGYGWLDTKSMTIRYATNGMPDYGADQMYQACKSAGTLNKDYGAVSTMPEIPGLMLWKSGHAGVYIGGGYAIEAMGTSKGVVKTKVSDRNWQGWGKLPYIDYREGN